MSVRQALVMMSATALAGAGLVVGSSPAAAIDLCTVSGALVLGTSGDDDLVGTEQSDVFYGFAGDDIIRGLGGNDIVFAGPGDDTVYGQGCNDRLFGGDGVDALLGGAGSGDFADGGREINGCDAETMGTQHASQYAALTVNGEPFYDFCGDFSQY